MLRKTVIENILMMFSAFFLVIMFGCNKTITGPSTTELSTNNQAMMKIADSDSSISSFLPNYDEEIPMDISTDQNGNNIYPIKVGQKLRLVSRNLTYTVNGDTAYGNQSVANGKGPDAATAVGSFANATGGGATAVSFVHEYLKTQGRIARLDPLC